MPSACPILVAVMVEVNVAVTTQAGRKVVPRQAAQQEVRLVTRARGFLATLALAATSLPARAAVAPCPSGDNSLPCRLHSLLNLLSVTAVVLGTLLVLALIVAVWYYRRNRNKDLLPR